MKTNFKPTQSMIEATKAVLVAMAYEKTIRPVVESYQSKVLQEMNATSRYNGRKIIEPKHAYLMTDDQLAIYHNRIADEAEKAGFTVPSREHCPLLIAEDNTRKAKRALLESMQPVTGIDASAFLRDLKAYNRAVELTLQLMTRFVTA